MSDTSSSSFSSSDSDKEKANAAADSAFNATNPDDDGLTNNLDSFPGDTLTSTAVGVAGPTPFGMLSVIPESSGSVLDSSGHIGGTATGGATGSASSMGFGTPGDPGSVMRSDADGSASVMGSVTQSSISSDAPGFGMGRAGGVVSMMGSVVRGPGSVMQSGLGSVMRSDADGPASVMGSVTQSGIASDAPGFGVGRPGGVVSMMGSGVRGPRSVMQSGLGSVVQGSGDCSASLMGSVMQPAPSEAPGFGLGSVFGGPGSLMQGGSGSFRGGNAAGSQMSGQSGDSVSMLGSQVMGSPSLYVGIGSPSRDPQGSQMASIGSQGQTTSGSQGDRTSRKVFARGPSMGFASLNSRGSPGDGSSQADVADMEMIMTMLKSAEDATMGSGQSQLSSDDDLGISYNAYDHHRSRASGRRHTVDCDELSESQLGHKGGRESVHSKRLGIAFERDEFGNPVHRDEHGNIIPKDKSFCVSISSNRVVLLVMVVFLGLSLNAHVITFWLFAEMQVEINKMTSVDHLSRTTLGRNTSGHQTGTGGGSDNGGNGHTSSGAKKKGDSKVSDSPGSENSKSFLTPNNHSPNNVSSAKGGLNGGATDPNFKGDSEGSGFLGKLPHNTPSSKENSKNSSGQGQQQVLDYDDSNSADDASRGETTDIAKVLSGLGRLERLGLDDRLSDLERATGQDTKRLDAHLTSLSKEVVKAEFAGGIGSAMGFLFSIFAYIKNVSAISEIEGILTTKLENGKEELKTKEEEIKNMNKDVGDKMNSIKDLLNTLIERIEKSQTGIENIETKNTYLGTTLAKAEKSFATTSEEKKKKINDVKNELSKQMQDTIEDLRSELDKNYHKTTNDLKDWVDVLNKNWTRYEDLKIFPSSRFAAFLSVGGKRMNNASSPIEDKKVVTKLRAMVTIGSNFENTFFKSTLDGASNDPAVNTEKSGNARANANLSSLYYDFNYEEWAATAWSAQRNLFTDFVNGFLHLSANDFEEQDSPASFAANLYFAVTSEMFNKKNMIECAGNKKLRLFYKDFENNVMGSANNDGPDQPPAIVLAGLLSKQAILSFWCATTLETAESHLTMLFYDSGSFQGYIIYTGLRAIESYKLKKGKHQET